MWISKNIKWKLYSIKSVGQASKPFSWTRFLRDYKYEGMSHSGSPEYPLPLTRPTTTSLLSTSKLTHLQHTIEHQTIGGRDSSKSTHTSSSKDGLKESLEIYSVHNHQRHKIKQPSPVSAEKKNRINNNYDPEKVIINVAFGPNY